jgi:hypothetical protein
MAFYKLIWYYLKLKHSRGLSGKQRATASFYSHL